MKDEPLLLLEGAQARHPRTAGDRPSALRGVDLRVRPGERVAIIGPSGAGKTTLLHLLGCALPPSAGILRFDGADPWSLSRRRLQRLRARLFLAPQTPPLPPRQRVVTSVLAGRLPSMGAFESLRSLLFPLHVDEAEAALARFDLAEKLFDRVDRLSGGERQRVGLARAFLSPAELWLVDEPLSALDPTRAGKVLDALVSEAGSRGITLVASLHQVDLALRFFPRIVGLRDGMLHFDLPTAEVGSERLEALYASHEEELLSPAPVPAVEGGESSGDLFGR